MTDHADDYVVSRIEDGLAHDPRVAELGIHARLVSGGIYLSGSVTTPDRRDLIGVVAAELAPGYRIHNEVTICVLPEPSEQEVLS